MATKSKSKSKSDNGGSLKSGEYFNDIQTNTAIADLTGRRLGRVAAVFKTGQDKFFRVRWEDEESEVLERHQFLLRYTTESAHFSIAIPGSVNEGA